MLTDLQQETLEALWERRLYKRWRSIHRHDRDAEFIEYVILDPQKAGELQVLTRCSSAYHSLRKRGLIRQGRCRDWRKGCSRTYAVITTAGLQEMFS